MIRLQSAVPFATLFTTLFTARVTVILTGLLLFSATALPAQETPETSSLSLSPGDVRIEQTIEGGYYLYVRKTPGIESVLITESTEAPDAHAETYAYRYVRYHPENGDERRILDGEFLPDGHLSLIDSTPVDDDQFGQAFRVFIPYIVVYGYPWSRSGEVQVLDGTYMSVRTFGAPYADYSGGFRDNPFILRVTQRPVPTAEPEYMEEAVERLTEVADDTGGEAFESHDDPDIVSTIESLVENSRGRSLDLVVALDTTDSMEDNIPALRDNLVPMLRSHIGERDSLRVGLVYYRDYMEEYLTRRYDFQDNLDFVQRALDTVRVAGGRDIPEAVYEALYASVTGFDWQADAPPHPRPRGSVTREIVQSVAAEAGVTIHTIILPQ